MCEWSVRINYVGGMLNCVNFVVEEPELTAEMWCFCGVRVITVWYGRRSGRTFGRGGETWWHRRVMQLT